MSGAAVVFQPADAVVAAQAQSNGGFGLNMWATVVNRDGVVCAVASPVTHAGISGPGVA